MWNNIINSSFLSYLDQTKSRTISYPAYIKYSHVSVFFVSCISNLAKFPLRMKWICKMSTYINVHSLTCNHSNRLTLNKICTFFSMAKLSAYDHNNIVLTLPDGTTVADIVWLSVWCKQATVSLLSIVCGHKLQS
jgi:hypothetical protein